MPDAEKLDWYVVHTYSGYENKVMDSLKKTVDNRGLQDKIDQIEVPVEEVIQIKDGKRHTVQRKLFPGYVLVHMDEENQKLKVSVPLFGRDTIVDVDYEGARKVMEEDE